MALELELISGKRFEPIFKCVLQRPCYYWFHFDRKVQEAPSLTDLAARSEILNLLFPLFFYPLKKYVFPSPSLYSFDCYFLFYFLFLFLWVNKLNWIQSLNRIIIIELNPVTANRFSGEVNFFLQQLNFKGFCNVINRLSLISIIQWYKFELELNKFDKKN